MPRKRKARKSLVKTIQTVLNRNIETKNLSTTLVTFAFGSANTSSDTSTSQITQLIQMLQGDDIGERIGNVIHPIKFKIKCDLYTPVAGVQGFFRFILFRSNQQDSVVNPTVTDVLQSTAGIAKNVSLYDGNFVSNGNYTILVDKLISYDIYGSGIVKHWEVTLPKSKLRPMHFLANASTDVGKGQLFMLTCSDKTVTSGLSPQMDFCTQLWYKDA